jgi:UDP-glucose 4-epimerase
MFVERAVRGEDLQIHGDGSQVRAWCFVDDVVRAVLASLEREEAVGESFNIGNPRAVLTIHGLAEAVVEATGSSSRIVFSGLQFPDVEVRVPNVGKARRMLGFDARVDLAEGIRRTAEWARARLARAPAAERQPSELIAGQGHHP